MLKKIFKKMARWNVADALISIAKREHPLILAKAYASLHVKAAMTLNACGSSAKNLLRNKMSVELALTYGVIKAKALTVVNSTAKISARRLDGI